MMQDSYAKACSEVLVIISTLDKSLSDKIPINFINLLKKISDKEHVITIDKNKTIKEQNILKETKIILSLIYRNYIASDKERQKLIESEKLSKQKLIEKYDPNNIFKKKTSVIEEDIKENQLIEVRQESLIEKIFSKIKKFFNNK